MNRYKSILTSRLRRFEYVGDFFKDGDRYFIVWHVGDFGEIYETACMLNRQ